ncbi:MAG TPA: sensor histidine kinase [Pyrinomonadaceae bacterium]|nr:sensor histidine kinase [Pyrinomonadaceae bacterium]
MSIRGRLLTLALGGVVPLLVVGLVALWVVWRGKQQQLNESLEEQAELAAVVFDRWIDAQRQPLLTIASHPAARLNDPSAVEADLKAALTPRPHWLDLRVLGADGRAVATYPAGAEALPAGVADRLLGAARGGVSDVETDWTRGEGHYVLALAVPAGEGGAVVARMEGSALQEPLRGITLPDRALVTLLDPSRRIVYRSRTQESVIGADLSDSAMLAGFEGRDTTVKTVRSALDGVERVYGLARVGKTGYVVTLGVPSDILYASAWRQLTVYAAVGLVVVFCTMTAALLIARSIARPVRLLSFAAGQFGDGNFAARAPSEGRDEVSRLGASFNAMAERLERREARFAELDRLKSEFVSSVSHELRTPLTTIKALTRLLMRDGLDESKRREYLDTISVECDRQIDLVLNLLDLSRIEGGVFRIRHERVDVGEVISSCAKSQARAAEKRGHELRVEPIVELPPACADAKALRRVLTNVIENAIKYTPDGGRIRLAARAEDGHVLVSVADNGRGIPPEDMPVLFDKFHRGRPAPDSEATRGAATGAEFLEDADASGVGLGLYLGRNVMEQMGGRITVESEVGRGSTFTLHLPAWREGGCGARAEAGGESDGEATAGR